MHEDDKSYLSHGQNVYTNHDIFSKASFVNVSQSMKTQRLQLLVYDDVLLTVGCNLTPRNDEKTPLFCSV